jgi:hypothetical protein
MQLSIHAKQAYTFQNTTSIVVTFNVDEVMALPPS